MNLHGSFVLRKTLTELSGSISERLYGPIWDMPRWNTSEKLLCRMFSLSPFRPTPGLVQQRQLLSSVSDNVLSTSNPTIKLYVN